MILDKGNERLCNLFFEISNEDRLGIMLKLLDEPMRLTQISKEFDLSVQEASRQLSRLSEIDLVTKNADGLYLLQPYGKNAIRLFPGFQFLTEHVEYFTTHTLDYLPEVFMNRIGELKECTPINELMLAMSRVTDIVEEAEEYFWYMSEERLVTSKDYKRGIEIMDKGVQFKYLEPVGYHPPIELLRQMPPGVREGYGIHRAQGTMVSRMLEKIEVTIYMNEKEVGILAFPSNAGEFDYLGFSSNNSKVWKWCKDVFNYYWDHSSPYVDTLPKAP